MSKSHSSQTNPRRIVAITFFALGVAGGLWWWNSRSGATSEDSVAHPPVAMQQGQPNSPAGGGGNYVSEDLASQPEPTAEADGTVLNPVLHKVERKVENGYTVLSEPGMNVVYLTK